MKPKSSKVADEAEWVIAAKLIKRVSKINKRQSESRNMVQRISEEKSGNSIFLFWWN